MRIRLHHFAGTTLFKVTNYFHFVRYTGEMTQQQVWPNWFLPLPHLLSWPGHFSWFLSYLTPFLTASWSEGLFPCGGSVLAPLLFFCLLSIFTSLVSSSSLMQRSSKFISSLDPGLELQTHISKWLLSTALGCLITTSWTALPTLLLPQPCPS